MASGRPHEAQIDQHVGGTRPADFAADVRELVTFVTLVTTPETDVPWQSHPIFGRMSRAAWLRWSYLHIDHHLRQFGA
jgi:hypothetical protein